MTSSYNASHPEERVDIHATPTRMDTVVGTPYNIKQILKTTKNITKIINYSNKSI